MWAKLQILITKPDSKFTLYLFLPQIIYDNVFIITLFNCFQDRLQAVKRWRSLHDVLSLNYEGVTWNDMRLSQTFLRPTTGLSQTLTSASRLSSHPSCWKHEGWLESREALANFEECYIIIGLWYALHSERGIEHENPLSRPVFQIAVIWFRESRNVGRKFLVDINQRRWCFDALWYRETQSVCLYKHKHTINKIVALLYCLFSLINIFIWLNIQFREYTYEVTRLKIGTYFNFKHVKTV